MFIKKLILLFSTLFLYACNTYENVFEYPIQETLEYTIMSNDYSSNDYSEIPSNSDIEHLEIDENSLLNINWFFDEIRDYNSENLKLFFNVFHDGGVNSDTSIYALKNMYQALNYYFDYIAVNDSFSLYYLSYFTGDDMFLNVPEGFEHTVRNIWDENMRGFYEYFTSLKSVFISRTAIPYFEDMIYIGRNFSHEDFYKNTYDDVMPAILGYEYIGIYEIGDILVLGIFNGFPVNFEVIGFFEEGATFQQMNSPIFYNIYLDTYIAVPFFYIMYEPFSHENLSFQIVYHHIKASGNIFIRESVDTVTSSPESLMSIFYRYRAFVQELGELHGLLYDITLLPIPLYIENNSN